ncbi:hypothetical protein TNCT_272621 [Trichonephila clavata]|uniref:Uncharacterized protein n=1 Tax=Trichonephila clavata TaxID=2740835 RepID=A0A8X6GWD5_TRICU|nr:hypothetical protein TNCT_272621 [Trichonephila clavata]
MNAQQLTVDRMNMYFKIIKILGDGACLFSVLSYLIHDNVSMAIQIRKAIVPHVCSEWKRFKCFTQGPSGVPYDESTPSIQSKKKEQNRKRFTSSIRYKQVRKAFRKFTQSHPEVHRDAVQKYTQSYPEVYRDAVRKYTQSYPEVNRNAVRKYTQNHPEVHTDVVWKYTQSHPEVHRDAVRKYTQSHLEVNREAVRKYTQRPPEVNRKTVKKYVSKNPHVARTKSNK